MAVKLATSAVLPPSQEITVCVLGDANTGKSSLIQSFIGRKFPAADEVRPVVDPIRLTPDTQQQLLSGRIPLLNPRVLIDTNGVELGASGAAVTRTLKQHKPDVAVLTYALDDPMSLAHVAQHWLPSIVSSGVKPAHWPYLPIVLCGTKRDALSEAAGEAEGAEGAGGAAEEHGLAGAASRAEWLSAYRFIRAVLKEAGLLSPSTDAAEAGGEAGAEGEEEQDGELAHAPAFTLLERCLEDILAAYKSVQSTVIVSAAEPEAAGGLVAEVGGVWDRAADAVLHPVFPLLDFTTQDLTPAAGAAATRIFRILDGDRDGVLSVDEFSVYQTIAFGIRLSETEVESYFSHLGSVPGAVTEDYRCLTEAGFMHMMVDYIYNLATDSFWQTLHAFGYRWGVPPASASTAATAPAQQPCQLYLHMPLEYASLRPSNADSCLLLSGSSSGVKYDSASVSSLKRMAGTGLAFVASLFDAFSTDAARRLLSIADVQHMFEPTPAGKHPFGKLYPSCTTHNAYGDIALPAWLHLWQTLAATDPRAALTALYELGFTTPGLGDCDFDFDPRKAVEEGVRRKLGEGVPSPLRRVFVVGSQGSGKTSVIVHFVNGSGGLRQLMQQSEGLPATSTVCHYAAAAPTFESESLPVSAAALPTTLAITEWPSAALHDAMEAADGAADALLLVVDPSNPASIAYLRKAVALVPDGVPTMVVATQHEGAGKQSRGEQGVAVLAALCSDQPTIDLRKLVTDMEMCASSDGDAELSAFTPGLSLELFDFWPRAKDAKSQDLFRYITARATQPAADNPTTAERRRRVWRQRMVRRLAVLGMVVLGAGAVAVGVAYATADKDTKGRVTSALEGLKDKLGLKKLLKK